MEVAQLYALARRWYRLLIVCIAIGMVIAFGIAQTLPKTYASTATLLVGQPFTATTDILAANKLQADLYAELATLRPLMEGVISSLSLQETPSQLADKVIARASHTSNLLTITVSNSRPDTAANIANAVARALIALAPNPTDPSAANLTVVEPAEPDASPVSPKVGLITAMGAAGGVLGAAGVIVKVVSGSRRARPASATKPAEGSSEPGRWPADR